MSMKPQFPVPQRSVRQRARMRQITGICLLAMLAGCIPLKRVVWSPDGRHAIVLAGDGPHAMKPDGTLSKVLPPPNGTDAEWLPTVSWMPDSKSALLIAREGLSKWQDVGKHIDEASQRVIAAKAAVLLEDLRLFSELGKKYEEKRAAGVDPFADGINEPWEVRFRNMLETDSPERANLWASFKPASLQDETITEVACIAVYLKSNHYDEVHTLLGNQASILDDDALKVAVHHIFRVAVNDGEFGESKELIATIRPIDHTFLSPDGKFLAWVASGGTLRTSEVQDLTVVQLNSPGKIRRIAHNVAITPAWSADSKSLVFFSSNGRPDNGGSDSLWGSLCQAEVVGADGNLSTANDPQPTVYCGVLFTPLCSIECLPDGRIAFSSFEGNAPTTTSSSTIPQLYIIDPSRQQVPVCIYTERANLAGREAIPFVYSFSPDGKRAAVQSIDGAVSIVTLPACNFERIVPIQDDDRALRSIPTWRNNDELCLVLPAGDPNGSPKRAEVALWKDGTFTVLSRDWPEEAVNDFLQKAKSK